MKKYKKPMIATVVTPDSLMDSDKINIPIAASPSHETGEVGAKQFNGIMDWDEEELSPEESTSPQSSWN